MRSRGIRMVAAGTAVALAATLAGCSTNSSGKSTSNNAASSGSSSAPAGGSSSAASSSSVKLAGNITFNDVNLGKLRDSIKAALKGKNVSKAKPAVVVNVSTAYWDPARAGAKQASKELGVHAIFQEPTKQDINEQHSIVNTLLSQGITGLSISAIQAASLSDSFSTATKKGVDLMAIDSPMKQFKNEVPIYLGTPNYEAGHNAGEAMRKLLPKGGDVAIIVGSLTATNATQRIAGFKDALKGSGVKVFQTYNDNGDANKALQDANAAFQADPNIKGLYGVYSYDGPSAGQAVQSSGKDGKVVVVADDTEPKTLQLLKSGAIQATVVQQPYQQAYMSVYILTAMKVLGKQATLKLIKPYLESDGYTLSSGVGLVTPGNLAAYDKKMTAYGVKTS